MQTENFGRMGAWKSRSRLMIDCHRICPLVSSIPDNKSLCERDGFDLPVESDVIEQSRGS